MRGHLFLQSGLYLSDSEQISIHPRDGNGIFPPKGALNVFQSAHLHESFTLISMNHSSVSIPHITLDLTKPLSLFPFLLPLFIIHSIHIGKPILGMSCARHDENL